MAKKRKAMKMGGKGKMAGLDQSKAKGPKQAAAPGKTVGKKPAGKGALSDRLDKAMMG